MRHNHNQPIELLKSGQLLAVTDCENSGIILQKPFFAEFVGPGSAVGGLFDLECVTLYTLGSAEFTVPETFAEKQSAFRRRMDDIQTLQDLCNADTSLRRAVDLLEMLCNRFNMDDIRTIPDEVLAKVVGVLPSTIRLAWQKQFNLQSPADEVHEPDLSLLSSLSSF